LTPLSQLLGPLDESSALPLYQQLQRTLRDAIDKRILDADDALPAERDLAADFSVSRITVRKAIEGLVSEGLLVRQLQADVILRRHACARPHTQKRLAA
jgi:GntR family transcriptional regulator